MEAIQKKRKEWESNGENERRKWESHEGDRRLREREAVKKEKEKEKEKVMRLRGSSRVWRGRESKQMREPLRGIFAWSPSCVCGKR
jgi:hypothetical protein